MDSLASWNGRNLSRGSSHEGREGDKLELHLESGGTLALINITGI